jgi:hypothetical protein
MDLDPNVVANIVEACVMLASDAGMDVVNVLGGSLKFDIAKNGDVTLTVTSADGKSDTGKLLAADIMKASDEEEDEAMGASSTMPPAAPIG